MFNFIKSLFVKKEVVVPVVPVLPVYEGFRISKTKYNDGTFGCFVHVLEGEKEVGFIHFKIFETEHKGQWKKICHVEQSWIQFPYRGKGYGKKLYLALAEVWHKEKIVNGSVFKRTFASPVSYTLAKSLVDNGILPAYTWDDSLIKVGFHESELIKKEVV